MASPGKRAADSSLLLPPKRGPSWRQISIYSSSSSSNDSIVIEIPEALDSLETLTWCGFDEDVASTFIVPEWEHQNTLFPERDRTLMDEAMRYMRSKILDENENWQASLKLLGLKTDLINRIMNPEYDDIRVGGTPLFWAVDSVQEAYSYLSYIIKKEEMVLKEDPERINSPAPNATPQKAMKISGTLGPDRTDILWIAAQKPQNTEGRQLFYKGGSKHRLQQVFGGANGIDLTAILSTPPTDFHPTSASYLYFTKQRDVALQYCRYQAERVPPIEPALLVMALPTSTLPEQTPVFGDDWFDLIWSSRREETRRQNRGKLPEHLKSYEEADILMGDVCNTSSDKMSRLNDKREITRIRIRVGDRDVKASQIVFTSEQAFNYLTAELRAAPEFLAKVVLNDLHGDELTEHLEKLLPGTYITLDCVHLLSGLWADLLDVLHTKADCVSRVLEPDGNQLEESDPKWHAYFLESEDDDEKSFATLYVRGILSANPLQQYHGGSDADAAQE